MKFFSHHLSVASKIAEFLTGVGNGLHERGKGIGVDGGVKIAEEAELEIAPFNGTCNEIREIDTECVESRKNLVKCARSVARHKHHRSAVCTRIYLDVFRNADEASVVVVRILNVAGESVKSVE